MNNIISFFHKGQVSLKHSLVPHSRDNTLRSGCSDTDGLLTIPPSTTLCTQLGIYTCNEYDIGGAVWHDMTVLHSNFIVKIKCFVVIITMYH